MDLQHLNGLILATLFLVPGYLFAQAKGRLVIYDKPETLQEKLGYTKDHSKVVIRGRLSLQFYHHAA